MKQYKRYPHLTKIYSSFDQTIDQMIPIIFQHLIKGMANR
jgi:hypothetical protein